MIDRFNFVAGDGGLYTEIEEDGEYVTYEDYEKEIKLLTDKINLLKKVITKGFINA